MSEVTVQDAPPPVVVDKPTAVNLARHYQRRYDRWENETNRFGSDTDPISVTRYQPGIILNRIQLDNLYEFDWISAKIVDIPAEDAFRKWITLHHETDPAKAEAAKKILDQWNLRGHLLEGERLARLHGGALVVFGAFDGTEVSEPLDIEKIRQVMWIDVVDRWIAVPHTFFRDPGESNFGDVESYMIHRIRISGSDTSIVHSSRVIRMNGRYVPPLRRLRNFGWFNSVLVRVYDVIRQFGVSVQSGSGVLQDFVVKKLKISNLQDLIASGQFDIIEARIQVMAREMAINNIALYGSDEEIEKIGTPIQGLPKLMELFIDYVSAAADIPRSRLFQNVTGTLGGDPGKNDLRVHYDNIEAMQENKLRPPVQQGIDILLAPHGFKPGEITFTWNPLWQMTDKEQAEIGKLVADTDVEYVRAGIVEPEEVAISRFSGDEVDLRNMVIDVDRRKKALEDLKKVDLVRPEPEFDPDEPPTDPDNDDNDDDDLKKDAANLTSRNGRPEHRHTFDIDPDGNGQTADTLDDDFPHIHVIRSWRIFEAGAAPHTHSIRTVTPTPGDMTHAK